MHRDRRKKNEENSKQSTMQMLILLQIKLASSIKRRESHVASMNYIHQIRYKFIFTIKIQLIK